MDVEKTIEFILGQQAQFSADMAVIDGRLDRLAATTEQLAQENRAIARAVHAIMEHSQNNAVQIEKNAIQIAALTEKVDQTTDNLNALIKVVDGLVRGKNGGAH